MPQSTIPQNVVAKDHELEGRSDRASEALAKHRWHWTLDESNPQRVSPREYAKVVGRAHVTIFRHAKGYALYTERMSVRPGATVGGFTIQDAIRLAELKVEDQEFAEAIAQGSGKSVAQVARGDNRHKMHAIVGQAKDRAERRGTNAVDEARDLAEQHRKTREMDAEHRKSRAKARTFRYIGIEGDLASAKRKLLNALKDAEGVDFSEEELDLIRDSIAQVRAVLNLLDLRMSGDPNVDWDAEFEKIGELS